MASLGAILALIVISVGGLVLGVLGVMMMIGAVMPKRSVITSWPQAQEASFHAFDTRNQGSQSKAWLIAICSSVGVFFVICGIYAAVPPEKHDISKTMNMSNLTKKDGPGAQQPKAAPVKVEEKKPEQKPEEKKPEEKKDEKAEEKPAEKPAEAPKKK